MKLLNDWLKLRKNGVGAVKKDFANTWFQLVFILLISIVVYLMNDNNRYMRLAGFSIIIYWITTYITTRFSMFVWAALIIGLFHIHLAHEIKRGLNEKTD